MRQPPAQKLMIISSTANAVPIPAGGLDLVWPHVEGWIKAATDHATGHWKPEHVREQIASGAAQLWVVMLGQSARAAIVTEIEDGPSQRIGRIAILGGVGFRKWRRVIDQLEAWAREQGAQEMEIIGRDEWRRVLASDGYQQRAIVLRKPL